MLKDFFRSALRNVLRHRLHNLISVSSLAVGLSCAGLIFLYASEELSYDSFNRNESRTYRLTWTFARTTPAETFPRAPLPLAPLVAREIPSVESITRLFHYGDHTLIRYGDKAVYEDRFFFSDPSFSDVFTVQFIQGDPKRALLEPYSVVLTESSARKYFGTLDPLGKVLSVAGFGILKVTGVMRDIPRNSHIRINILASMATLKSMLPERIVESWGNVWTYTYLVARQNVNVGDIGARFPGILSEHYAPGADSAITIGLQPLSDIHLRSHFPDEIESNGDSTYLYLLLAAGAFVLMLSCINFINLNAAGWGVRSKEIWIRKVLGSGRASLLVHLVGESLLVSVVALFLASALIEILLPSFNNMMAKELTADFIHDWPLSLGLFALALTVGVISGILPGYFLSGISPDHLIRRELTSGPRAASLRTALVIFQFGVSIALLTGTLVARSQFNYIRSKDLGFQKSGLIVIQMRDSTVQASYARIENELSKVAGVAGVAAVSSEPPSESINFYGVKGEGSITNNLSTIQTLFADFDFLSVFGARLIAGRNFSTSFPTDSTSAFIINETAALELGWGNPSNALGKRIELSYSRNPPRKGAVIGLVKDFHFSSLYRKVEPLVITVLPDHLFYLAVRVRDDDRRGVLERLGKEWNNLGFNIPFEYEFVEDRIDNQYRGVARAGDAFEWFTGVALLIACAGLFGITAFNTARRTKEIGIRKVCGASTERITLMLLGSFLKQVCIASLFAVPLSYLLLQNWLHNFAYQVPIRPAFFVLSAGMALITGVCVVIIQTLKAASVNPVSSLRYE